MNIHKVKANFLFKFFYHIFYCIKDLEGPSFNFTDILVAVRTWLMGNRILYMKQLSLTFSSSTS